MDRGVAADQPRPLGSYMGLMVLFNVLVGGFLLLLRRRHQGLPDRVSLADLLLLGLGTYTLSRLITKDIVTSPIRAPFTEYQGQGFGAEVHETPRGAGLQRALGELLTCPYCLGQWVAAAAAAGLVVAPRLTRFIASTLSLLALADLLHVTYETLVALRQRVSEDEHR